MSVEQELRDKIVRVGALLYARRLAHGNAGNLSIRMETGEILVTPTSSCLGFLSPDRVSKLSVGGELLSGDPPSKEAFFHLAMYEQRPEVRAVVHLHSTYSVAASCLNHENKTDVLPPLTAYYVMRVGKLPLLPYFRPGDRALADAVSTAAREHPAMLLANHGPIVAAKSLEEAVYAYEELEETAKIFFLLKDRAISALTLEAVAELNRAFPN